MNGRVGGLGVDEEVSTPDEVDEDRETHDLAKGETFPSVYLVAALENTNIEICGLDVLPVSRFSDSEDLSTLLLYQPFKLTVHSYFWLVGYRQFVKAPCISTAHPRFLLHQG